MRINYYGGAQEITLQGLAEDLGVEIEVNERPKEYWQHGQFWAHLPYVEIKNGAMLEGAGGDGDTPGQACARLCERLAGKRLVYRAYSEDRREIDAPNKITWDGK